MAYNASIAALAELRPAAGLFSFTGRVVRSNAGHPKAS